jgi:hypothetical protein
MNSSEAESSLILKTDALNRVQVPREQREAILDEFERGSLTGAAFARHYGIKYQTFAGWRQQRFRKRKKAAGSSEPIQLAEVVVEAPGSSRVTSSEGLRIELPDGGWMIAHNEAEAALAAVLLNALGADRSC